MRVRSLHLAPGAPDASESFEDELVGGEDTIPPQAESGPAVEADADPGPAGEGAQAEEPKAPPPRTLVDILREQLAEKEEKLHQYIAAYKEAKRDMDDRLSRAKRDREKLIDRDRKQLGGELLEVMDNLDRSIVALGASPATEGLRMVHRQFGEVLHSFGVERMDALGSRFDAKVHEAIGMIPAQPGQEDQEIVHVDRAGYVFKGEMLRPARVIVATRG